ncbi:MAG: glycoside hydrolase family 3 N-terminal domain-containing protein, partial [Clostridia bacterium]|nr:glycoside hydrolase family 3 N-terminal domain-containing protein [Clostridia bacterium]
MKKRKSKIIVIVLIIVILAIAITSTFFLLWKHDKLGNGDIYDDPYNTENGKNGDDVNPNEQEIISKDLFGKYYPQALEKMKSMSLEEKVGQMFFARFPESGVIEEIKSQNPGGYIMFGRDFKNKNKTQITAEIKKYQESTKIPLLMGVDEEGGTVVRITCYKGFANEAFKSPQELYKKGGFDLFKEDTVNKAKLLSGLGINVNLAPVSDVPSTSSDYICD